MINFTDADVDNLETLFKNRGYQPKETHIERRNFRYYALPPEINPELPDFILRITNNSSKRYVIGVSTDVPPIIRDYFALAEYIEFLELGLDIEGRVAKAEEIVLGLLEPPLKSIYVQRKLRLFRKELELDQLNPQKYCLEDEGRREFLRAIDCLENKLD